MIQIQNFTLNVLTTHKAFFLLDNLPKSASQVDVWIQTPAGLESVDFIDVFAMEDGSLLAAWKHPYQKLPLKNLVVFADGVTQVLNLYTIERMVDFYDRPVDANSGTFIFNGSQVIEGAGWRCDNGYYGSKSIYAEEITSPLINSVSEIVAYEPFMSMSGIGHIIYVESNTANKPELAQFAVEKLNNSIAPVAGRTFQEVLRLVYEWSVLAQEPFSSNDVVSVTAKMFLEAMSFTETEIELIKELSPMQISNFISGSTNARVRPNNIPSLSVGISNILFRRMASSSLSFIVARNPNIWDFDEIIQTEELELTNGIARFRSYYGIPEYEPLDESGRAVEFAEVVEPRHGGYVQTQLRGFKNKRIVMDKAITLHQ